MATFEGGGAELGLDALEFGEGFHLEFVLVFSQLFEINNDEMKKAL